MERFPAASGALIRRRRYAAASFSATPTAISAAAGKPQRQVVNRYRSLCHSARTQRRTPYTTHRASIIDPTTPVCSDELLLAIMYAAFRQIDPTMDTGADFAAEYKAATQMRKA